MTGKVLEAETNFKLGDKSNSNMVKISAAKSILSYQNGSAPNSENRGCTTEEGALEEGPTDEGSSPEDPFAAVENINSECLDLLRKKLISDLSLAVFSCDLENKFTKMEPIKISKERQAIIQKLVVQISQLSDPEKLLLYLKLPSSTSSPFDPLRQPLNPLGNRQEIQQTIVWIKTHLEEDSEISIPKQDVYDQYLKYCENVSMKPLSTADFGKVMKQVYPGVRPRRLGTRGNSRYCYSGMRNTCKLPTPILPRSSMENSQNVSNGCATNVSPFLSADANKLKKMDKTKRKWPSSACRGEKCSSSKKSPPFDQEKTSTCLLKASKRSKAQKETEETGETFDSEQAKKVTVPIAGEVKSEEVDLGIIKCEDCSDNSFSAFDIESELNSDYGDYLKKTEEAEDNSISNSTDMSIHSRTNLEIENGVYKSESDATINKQSDILTTAGKSGTTVNGNSVGDQTPKACNNIAERVNGSCEIKDTVLEKEKGSKTKCKKSSSLVKHCNKNLKKSSYVPIQPKPTEGPKLSIRFRPSQTPAEKKKEAEGLGLCEESDSQEPEEEIVRYFKHLDETDMNAANGLVDEAVKNIDSNSVQINSISQLMANTRNPVPYGTQSDEIMNQQIHRSQSCFGDQEGGRGFSVEEKAEPMYLPRSQSTVELPSSNDPSHSDSDSGLDGRKNKISHLRILLEKSIPSSVKNPYSRSLSVGNGVSPSAPNPIGQVISRDSNFVFSNVKPPDRDLFKLNGLKGSGKGSPFVPQSPNTRTKYFSFTPISPGPPSPMKTSHSGSPFVSPRNTPVPRSRQNSHNDHFLSPSERKSGYQGENFFNFNKSTVVNSRIRGCRSPTISQSSRPRSNSSTNFYRSRSRRLLSKPSGLDRPNHLIPKNHAQPITPNGFAMNSSFTGQPTEGHLVGGESLSDEVQDFLENSTKIAETQVATIRSRSVPLNRMIGESNWLPTQASPVFPQGYFDAGNTPDQGKPSDLVPDSGGHSIKVISAASISGFVDNAGEMASLSGEIFTGNSTMASLNDHYFSEDFQRSGDENFVEQPFSEDSTFSSKLDLNSNGTFDNTFASESDVAITENIKSYLPDFDGLDNKNLVDPSNERPDVAQEKLFKNALYGGGNDNLKDPVITSFKPVLMTEMTSSPGSPVLNFFANKMNEDSQQLIEFFDFED